MPLTDEETESYNNKKFCYICKRMFNVNDTDGNSDDDNNDNSDGEKFDIRMFHSNAAGLDDVDDD